MIDGSYSELLAEQAVDDAAGDDETDYDEERCQTWSGFDHGGVSSAARAWGAADETFR